MQKKCNFISVTVANTLIWCEILIYISIETFYCQRNFCVLLLLCIDNSKGGVGHTPVLSSHRVLVGRICALWPLNCPHVHYVHERLRKPCVPSTLTRTGSVALDVLIIAEGKTSLRNQLLLIFSKRNLAFRHQYIFHIVILRRLLANNNVYFKIFFCIEKEIKTREGILE